MKRVFALILAAAMLLSLAACSSEKKDYEKAVKLYEQGDYENAAKSFEKLGSYEDSADYLVKANDAVTYGALKGHWATESTDLSGMVTNMIGGSLANEGDEFAELMNYFDFSMYSAVFTIDFGGDGTYVLGLDEVAYEVVLEKMAASMKNGFVNMITDLLNEEAGEYGMTAEEFLGELGIDSIEDFVSAVMDIDLDDFIAATMMDPLSELSTQMKSAGTYSVENGVVLMNYGDGADKGSLDPASGRFILTAENLEGMDEAEAAVLASLFPLEFTKK